jgi:hypothetical protein
LKQCLGKDGLARGARRVVSQRTGDVREGELVRGAHAKITAHRKAPPRHMQGEGAHWRLRALSTHTRGDDARFTG